MEKCKAFKNVFLFDANAFLFTFHITSNLFDVDLNASKIHEVRNYAKCINSFLSRNKINGNSCFRLVIY